MRLWWREHSGGSGRSRGCAKNKPLVLSDGTMLCGASTFDKAWLSFVDMSIDGGVSWVAGRKLDVLAKAREKMVHDVCRSSLTYSSVRRSRAAQFGGAW